MTVPPLEAPAPAPAAAEAPRARLSGTVVGLGIVSLLTDASSEMVYTQVPIFLTRYLGAPASVVGLIEGIAESTASLLRLASGWVSDRWRRRKPLVVFGYASSAAAKPLLALPRAWGGVLALRFFDRFGKGIRTAPRDALITESSDISIRGKAFGLHRAMDSTGAILGPLLGVWFLTHISGNLRHLFVFAGIPGLMSVVTIIVLVREKRPAGGAQEGDNAETPIPRFRWRDMDPAYRRFLVATLIFNLGNSSDAFLVLRAQSLRFSPREILWLYAAFNVVEAALAYSAGMLSDRVGRKPLVIAGYCVFGIVYLGLGLAQTKAAIWALFLLYGVYYTLTQGIQRAFASDLSDPAQRATQIGAYHTVSGCALLPASIIAGELYVRSIPAPFFYGAGMAAIGVTLLCTVRPGNAR